MAERKYRYRLKLAYKGSKYRGWQFQPGLKTVQAELETALSAILKADIKLHGCGRTDAGVHATAYFAEFNYPQEMTPDFVFILNKNLSADIAILDIENVGLRQNVQRDALSRTYEYRIHHEKNPFLNDTSSEYEKENLSFEKLQLCAQLLSGELDFRSYCKRPDLNKHTRCMLFRSEWEQTAEGLKYTVEANRFLQGMVRILVGTMLEVAYGSMTLEQFKVCLHEQEPLEKMILAHPQGLSLADVKY